MQNEWKLYFLFSEKEQKGMIALGVILCGSLLLSWWLPKKNQSSTIGDSNVEIAIVKPFYFDPNSIDSVDALKIGIPLKQVTTLMKYRRKGGRFYRKEQLANLYGLSKELVAQLTPYVRIATENTTYKYSATNHGSFPFKHSNDWTIDINAATEIEWKHKTHLSMSLIKRIMRYKNFIGSFRTIQDLKKVYGLEDTSFSNLYKHLKVQNQSNIPFNANALRFQQWQALGLFSNTEIHQIIKHRHDNGGVIGWREIAELCDLTEEQTNLLRRKLNISD